PPPVKEMPVDQSLQERASAELEKALSSNDPLVRAHAVEAVRQIGGEGSHEAILAALNDESPIVRFAATLAAGEMRIAAAKDRLLELAEDASLDVQIGARFALHMLGDYRLSHDLEQYAVHATPRIRGNTVM